MTRKATIARRRDRREKRQGITLEPRDRIEAALTQIPPVVRSEVRPALHAATGAPFELTLRHGRIVALNPTTPEAEQLISTASAPIRWANQEHWWLEPPPSTQTTEGVAR